MKSHDENHTQNRKTAEKSNAKEATKKSYHRPQLLIYGNIREITRGLGSLGAPDMPGKGKTA